MRAGVYAALLITASTFGLAQDNSGSELRQPLYQVTIVSRTTKALNYGYLSAPTRIGFRGSPVAASAEGSGVIEPKRGATLVKLSFDRLPLPSRFGAQYLTYVVWAISPEGRAQNLGEIITDGADKGKLSTSTPLQTFALIVTAEPYYSVSQPSDVVVLENVLTRDTIGAVQEVNATYELLPRKPYTHDVNVPSTAAPGQPVSQEQYESITALYQALNAIQIAQSQGADHYARAQMARAREIYDKARGYPVHLSKQIVSMAREAAQIAEDSRVIAVRRAAMENAAQEERPTEAQVTAPPPPPDAPRQEPVSSAGPRPSTRARMAEPQRPAAEPQPPVSVDQQQFQHDQPEAAENRRRVLASLPRNYEVLDSGRGITVVIPHDEISSSLVRSYFAAIAAAIRPYRQLRVHVEAHSDLADSTAATQDLAELVRGGLVNAGVPADRVIAQGLGNTRPRSSNATAGGRAQNRRVEIVIAGDDIGTLPAWDRTYSLRLGQPR